MKKKYALEHTYIHTRAPILWQEDGEQSGTEKYAVAIIYLFYRSRQSVVSKCGAHSAQRNLFGIILHLLAFVWMFLAFIFEWNNDFAPFFPRHIKPVPFFFHLQKKTRNSFIFHLKQVSIFVSASHFIIKIVQITSCDSK